MSYLEDVQTAELVTRDDLVILPDSLRVRQGDRAELHGEAVQTDQSTIICRAGQGASVEIHLNWLRELLTDQR